MSFDDDMETGYTIETGRRIKRPNRLGNRTALTLPPQSRPFASAIPGVPTPGRRKRPMGFSNGITFNSTSGTLLTLTAQIQKPFSPDRLFLSVARNGATAQTPLILVQSIKIGSDEQLIAPGVPVEMFAAQAFEVDVELDEAAAGLTFSVQISISAPVTTTDTIVVGCGVNGVTFG